MKIDVEQIVKRGRER